MGGPDFQPMVDAFAADKVIEAVLATAVLIVGLVLVRRSVRWIFVMIGLRSSDQETYDYAKSQRKGGFWG